MDWFRNYNEMPFDKKWPLVSKRSGQSILTIVGVWSVMLGCASEAKERGTLEDWDDEVIAAAMGVETEVISSVREAMQGLTLDGTRLIAWEKRQRVSDDVSARVRKHRDAKKSPPDSGNSGGNAAETGENATKPNGARGNDHVTACNVTETDRNVAETVFPLRATDSDSDTEDLDDDDARAREIAARVSRLTGLKPHELNIDVVKCWLKEGADPERDVIPGIEYTLTHTSQRSIRGFGYFSPMILEFRDRRLNPEPERTRPRLVATNSVKALKPSTARLLRRQEEAERSGWPS